MVAGMLMPRDRLRAIYEILFRDGVMVATNDERPQSRHAEVPGVTNLQVTKAMGSLKSRGLVRETFVWRHCYWYLTNEGIAYLRQYLHLPPEIVPASLQRVRRPVPPIGAPRRTPAANVQSIRGPTSYVPKPQGDVERQEYRRREQTVIQRGQDGTHGSTAPHVVENSWQEGGWQRGADRDEQKRGTSYPSHAFHVLNGGEKWGSSRESQKWDDGRKSSVERTALEITERRIAEKRLAETQGFRKSEVTSKQAVRAHADFLTGLSPIASIHERQEERREENRARESEIIINSVTSTSQLQYAGNKPEARLLQPWEEARNLVVEKSLEHHVVPLTNRTSVITHKTLETTNYMQGEHMEIKETSKVQKIFEQELKQQKGEVQSKKQKANNHIDTEVLEAVQASSIRTPLFESVKVDSKQEEKQKNDFQKVDHIDVQVTEAQVASNPEAVESQGQGSKRKNKKKKESEISEIPIPVTSAAPPITEAKADIQLEVKGQKYQKQAQEKTSEKEKKLNSVPNLEPQSEVKKEEPKSEAKKEEPKSEVKKEEPKPKSEVKKEEPKPKSEAKKEEPKPKSEAKKEEPKPKSEAKKEEPKPKSEAKKEEPKPKSEAKKEEPKPKSEAKKEEPKPKSEAKKEEPKPKSEAKKEEPKPKSEAKKEEPKPKSEAKKEEPKPKSEAKKEEPKPKSEAKKEEPKPKSEAKKEEPKPKSEAKKEEPKPKSEAKKEEPKPKSEAKKEEPKPKSEAKKEEPKPKSEAKKEEPKPKSEAKKEEPKPKSEAKKEEPKPKSEAKKEEPKPKSEAKKEEPKPKSEAKKEEPKPKSEAKKEEPKPKSEAKKEEPKPKSEAKKEEPKPKSEAKKEEPKSEAKKEEPKSEAKKEEPKSEAKKEEPKPKSEAKKEEPKPKSEAKKEEPKPKSEAKKEEPKPKSETKKEEPEQRVEVTQALTAVQVTSEPLITQHKKIEKYTEKVIQEETIVHVTLSQTSTSVVTSKTEQALEIKEGKKSKAHKQKDWVGEVVEESFTSIGMSREATPQPSLDQVVSEEKSKKGSKSKDDQAKETDRESAKIKGTQVLAIQTAKKQEREVTLQPNLDQEIGQDKGKKGSKSKGDGAEKAVAKIEGPEISATQLAKKEKEEDTLQASIDQEIDQKESKQGSKNKDKGKEVVIKSTRMEGPEISATQPAKEEAIQEMDQTKAELKSEISPKQIRTIILDTFTVDQNISSLINEDKQGNTPETVREVEEVKLENAIKKSTSETKITDDLEMSLATPSQNLPVAKEEKTVLISESQTITEQRSVVTTKVLHIQSHLQSVSVSLTLPHNAQDSYPEDIKQVILAGTGAGICVPETEPLPGTKEPTSEPDLPDKDREEDPLTVPKVEVLQKPSEAALPSPNPPESKDVFEDLSKTETKENVLQSVSETIRAQIPFGSKDEVLQAVPETVPTLNPSESKEVVLQVVSQTVVLTQSPPEAKDGKETVHVDESWVEVTEPSTEDVPNSESSPEEGM
ncbi:uncharacterized protein LOC143956640 [Lithobates pipiens]